ncbi:MAG: hypothetical protein MJ174_07530 [Treponema sp.]|nr:hypothetical protein [Treponema sp.]
MKKWNIENQGEFDFEDCYQKNYPPLDLEKYKKDRNYRFYELQNEYLLTHDMNVLWEMFPVIEGVCSSLAKKFGKGIVIPDFDGKVMEAALKVMQHYQSFPYFRAKKLENVAFHKVREVIFDKNLQINERTITLDALLELEQEEEEDEYKKEDLYC